MDISKVEQDSIDRINKIDNLLNNIWILICTIMVILSQVGYMMKETGTIKM
jgi:hypothetical protein